MNKFITEGLQLIIKIFVNLRILKVIWSLNQSNEIKI